MPATALVGVVVLLLTAACEGDAPSSAPAAPPTRIMIVGDSLAQESAGDYTWRYRLAQHLSASDPGRTDLVGDRDDLWDNVADVGGSHDYADPAFDTDHHSLWGRGIRHEVPVIERVVRAHPTDVMLLALGANDLSYWTNPTDSAALMKQLIDNARKANPNITFVVGHVLTRANFNTGGIALPQAVEFDRILDNSVAGWSTATSKVITARTDDGWNPQLHTWDGSHPNPDGEVVIARGFANALAELGVGDHWGPVHGGLRWPGAGRVPAGTGEGNRITLTWPATPGATQYFVEQRVMSWNETTFTRLPGAVAGRTWTSDALLKGATIAYRIVPTKGRMEGGAGPELTLTVGRVPAAQPSAAGTASPAGAGSVAAGTAAPGSARATPAA